MQDILADEVPALWLWDRLSTLAHRSRVKGPIVGGTHLENFEGVWVTDGKCRNRRGSAQPSLSAAEPPFIDIRSSVFTPGQPYKGSMTTTGENDELLPEKPTRQCISCFKEYDRTQTQSVPAARRVPQLLPLRGMPRQGQERLGLAPIKLLGGNGSGDDGE